MKYLLLIFAGVFIISCSSKSKEEKNQSSANTVITEELSHEQQPAKTIFGFLKWYQSNADRIAGLNLVNNNGNGDTTKLYSVNFPETEKYLVILKASGFVSEKYVETRCAYFKSCEDHFKKNQQYDGPPEGFDFDLVMQSQDFTEDLKNPDKATVSVISMDDQSAKLNVEFMYKWKLYYSLSKSGESWLIDKIENAAD